MKNKQFKYQNKLNLQKQATKIEKNYDSSAFTNNLHNLFYIQYFFWGGGWTNHYSSEKYVDPKLKKSSRCLATPVTQTIDAQYDVMTMVFNQSLHCKKSTCILLYRWH